MSQLNKRLFVALLILAVSAITSIATAEIKAEGRFTGTMTGNVKGSGKISGPISITINGDKATGNFSGKSNTGDSFAGSVTGTYDSATGTMKGTYSGSFNRMVGKKSIGAVAMKGSLNGKLSGSKFAGTWSGRGSGAWNATGTMTGGTVAKAPTETPAEVPKLGSTVWKPVKKIEGLKIVNGRISNASVLVNASNELRSIIMNRPGKKIKIDLMPGTSIITKGKIGIPKITPAAIKLPLDLERMITDKEGCNVPPRICIDGGVHLRVAEIGNLPEPSKFPPPLREAMIGVENTRTGKQESPKSVFVMHKATIEVNETQFVLVDRDDSSSIKMIEGSVNFKSLATGKSVTVSAGETVTATDKGLSKIAKFNIADEEARWDKAADEAGLNSWFGCTLNPTVN